MSRNQSGRQKGKDLPSKPRVHRGRDARPYNSRRIGCAPGPVVEDDIIPAHADTPQSQPAGSLGPPGQHWKHQDLKPDLLAPGPVLFTCRRMLGGRGQMMKGEEKYAKMFEF